MTIEEWAKDFKSYVNALDMQRDDYNGIIEYIDDALALLKEQSEADEVAPTIGEGAEGEEVIRCGSCGTALYHVFPWTKPGAPMKYASYCRNCGRPINWEPFEKSQE